VGIKLDDIKTAVCTYKEGRMRETEMRGSFVETKKSEEEKEMERKYN
jgi:hypothetical protein